MFIADHFTLCVLGHVSQWLSSGMTSDPYILTERISRILDGQVPHALTTFAQKPTMPRHAPDAQQNTGLAHWDEAGVSYVDALSAKRG